MHFCKPEVQNIGSSSGCGCDFPWAMFQNDGWPQCDYGEQDNRERQNIEALARLLKTLKDDSIELYGVWAGDYATTPKVREDISFAELLDPRFVFKERGFYTVRL